MKINVEGKRSRRLKKRWLDKSENDLRAVVCMLGM
jgi:hypothetical protein